MMTPRLQGERGANESPANRKEAGIAGRCDPQPEMLQDQVGELRESY